MAKDNNKERQRSPVNEQMLKVDGTSSIDGDRPGSTTPNLDVSFEDLGKLSEFPSLDARDNPEDGTGEWCVVLSDYLSGSGDDDHFQKGHVRRLSRIVTGYADSVGANGEVVPAEPNRDKVRSALKRLFTLGAIRKASRNEIGQDKIDVTYESESASTQAERIRRQQVEEENAILRERLGLAADAQIAATPHQATASDEAQQETGKQNAVDTTTGFDD